MASRMGTTVRSSAGAAWEGASVTKWGSDELASCSEDRAVLLDEEL